MKLDAEVGLGLIFVDLLVFRLVVCCVLEPIDGTSFLALESRLGIKTRLYSFSELSIERRVLQVITASGFSVAGAWFCSGSR